MSDDSRTGRHYTLPIDIPRTCWWSANDRLHWRARATRTKRLRETAAIAWQQAGHPTFTRAHITATVHYPGDYRADPANIISTVIKAIVDGVVDAGALPDDDHAHLIGPDARRGPKTGSRSLWRITLDVHELHELEVAP